MATTSAAELLGAQTKIRARGSRSKSCRIASMIVTVFPVPGLEWKKLGHSHENKRYIGLTVQRPRKVHYQEVDER